MHRCSVFFHPSDELKHLETIARASRQLRQEISALHPDVKSAWFWNDQGHIPEHLDNFLTELEAGLPFAQSLAKDGQSPAKRRDANVKGAALVEDCRNLWRLRNCREAPWSINEATRFGCFVRDVLDVCDAGDANAAMRLLKRMRGQIDEN